MKRRNTHIKFKTIASLTLAPAIALSSTALSAKEIWSDFSVTLLKGNDYLDPFTKTTETRNVVTIEHASAQTWGSTFLFIDRLSNPDEVYGELNINPTLYKTGGGFIKEVFLGLETEFGEGDTDQNNYLVGVGLSLDIPQFSYFTVAYYRRLQDDIDIDRGDNNQITFAWCIDEGNLRYDGFLDIIDDADTAYGTSSGGFNFSTQLKYNIAPALHLNTSRLDVGIEYVFWKNKYGVSGQTERNANLLLKWHF